MANDLKPEEFYNFKFRDLKKYVMRNYPDGKKRDQILSSLEKFWDVYVKEQFPTYASFNQAIQNCLGDLKIFIYSRKNQWQQNVVLTDDRVKKYLDLKRKLNSLKVHSPDDDIVLDAHDFNLRKDFLLDFITFDGDCHNGVSQIQDFQFDNIRGKDDYL
ncbi:hypothetical protein [Methanobrevibacter sp.]